MILCVVRLLARFPLAAAHVMGYVLGLWFFLIPNRERRQARINIDLCLPELTRAARRRLVRRCLIENAKTLMEMPGIWLGKPEVLVKRVIGREGRVTPEELLGQGKGLILAAPHIGSWELGIHYLARETPVTALYRPPREEVLENLIKAGRGRGGATLVPTTPQGVKALYRALGRNEMVIILPDQQPRSSKRAGVFAPFFGYPALTMVLINRLAQKTGAPVLFGYSQRLPWAGGYSIHFLPAPEGIGADDPVVAATALNKGVENCVRRCPEQYQWSYKRFSIRPDGGRSPYKQPLT